MKHINLIFLLGSILSACEPGAPTSSILPTVAQFPPIPTSTPTLQPPPTSTPTLQPSPTNTPTLQPLPTNTIPPTDAPPTVERIVIISIDGLRPDAISAETAPHIWQVAQNGAFTWQAQTVDPSVTLPAHASMLTGLDVDGHGITWNDYRPNRGPVQVPTVFSIAHDQGLRTAMIFGKEKFHHLVTPGALDTVFDRSGDSDFEIATYVSGPISNSFDLLFIHLPNVDSTGHNTLWMSPEYFRAVGLADDALGHMLALFNSAGLTETTLIIITADHGGSGITHYRDVPQDRTIPWVIVGPGVRAGHPLTTAVKTMDTAATVLFAFGLEVPDNWQGQPITEALTQ